MKVCIPRNDKTVSRKFGHASEYSFFVIEDGNVVSTETIKNPGHDKGVIPDLILAHSATHIVAGGIGKKARDIFHVKKVLVYAGNLGTVDTALERFLKGQLKDTEMSCMGDNLCGR